MRCMLAGYEQEDSGKKSLGFPGGWIIGVRCQLRPKGTPVENRQVTNQPATGDSPFDVTYTCWGWEVGNALGW